MRISIMTGALACCLAHGQAVDKTLTFEVASIKPWVQPSGNMIMMGRGGRGGPGSSDPGRVRYTAISLKNLLVNAYGVKAYQISGPSWLDSERFDIQATMPPETTKEQMAIMLQNLLADRFKLTIHRETKELPMYTMVVGKGGPKMKESVVPPPAPPSEDKDATPPPPPALLAGRGPLKMGPDGFPVLPLPNNGGRGGMFTMMMPNRARLTAQQQTMQDLASNLTNLLNRPVTDATELKAKFDFTLTYSPEGLNGPMGLRPPMPPPPPGGEGARKLEDSADFETPQDLFTAIQSQLGLKLEPKKGPVELIVVDHMEKTPTEN
jgi:uncharacterized protein (TIGR03435 family)